MAIIEMVMPKMGESVMEGTILSWLKEVGDPIEEDEAVLEVATDKVDTEIPATTDGVLKEKLVNDGDVVPVGQPIAKIETEVGAAEESAPKASPATPEPAPQPEPEAPPAPEEPEVQEAISHIESSISAAKGTAGGANAPQPAAAPYRLSEPAIGRFYSPLVMNIARQEGISMAELEYIPGSGADDRVTKKDILAYVEAKKAGKLQEQGQAEEQSPQQSPQQSQQVEPPQPQADPQPQQQASQQESPQPQPAPEPSQQPGPSTGQSAAASANGHQSSSAAFPESTSHQAADPGPVEEQPQHAAQQTQGQQATPKAEPPSGEDEIIELDRMRKMIAQRMVESVQTAPHVTSFVEADVTEIVNWRNSVKHQFQEKIGEPLTFTPMFVEAVAKALRDFPRINAQIDGDRLILKKEINIGLAVALPNGNLIVPVIRNADQLNLVGLTQRVNDLSRRARQNKLKMDDLEGGTFSVSNVGTFGNVMGTPIIMQPQLGIMAIGSIRKKPAVVETSAGDAIAIRHMAFLSHSYDHRVVDGALGGMFVKRVADYLQNFDANRSV